LKLGRFTLAGYVGGLLVGLGLIVTYGAMEASSTPRFCGSCHVMEPYYESWETSSHSSIACVDCHIPPGLTAELRKKYEAIAMVARYFTGTYSTNPWAEVDDAACLECHERRLLAGTEVFGDILFDHGPHLSELRRGKRLRCTSCHSQIVQGSHITVTSTSCILCHFKGQEPGTGTARCTLCHQVPSRVVDPGGLDFDHADVSRFGMDCTSCHAPAGPDAGRVPRERCVTCHNEPERLTHFGDGDLLHQTHITDHKVECTNCHLEVEHVAPRHAEGTRTECATCHRGGHSPQRTLYAGLGGKGVAPMPDVMFRAGVRCEGCHLDHGDGEDRTAGEVSCMSCHGPAYLSVFRGWKQTLERRVSGTRAQLEATKRLLGPAGPQALADAQENLRLVERGHGVHNFRYSLSLLQAAHRQVNEARESRNLRALRTPWPEPPYESACLECHAGAESATSSVFGKTFPHRAHVVGKGIECQVCHTTHEEREASGAEPLEFGASGCGACHHGDSGGDCLECHADVKGKTFPVEQGDFSHSLHVDDMELGCGDCHGSRPGLRASPDREVCSGCH
jgi:nitrate/TMAO reductase-like tetraheme cytochrome c subunit